MKRFAATNVTLLALVALAACSDAPSKSAPVAPPDSGHPAAGIARLHGTVDVAAGTMTFEG